MKKLLFLFLLLAANLGRADNVTGNSIVWVPAGGNNLVATCTKYVAGSGGNITIQTNNGLRYAVHAFTNGTANFTVMTGGNVEVLVVGGGGSGAKDDKNGVGCGGGGGGGVGYNLTYAVSPGLYTVTVGSGGNSATATRVHGNSGGNSVFDAITAYGGGGGGTGIGDCGSYEQRDG